jgi:hypothetical protein
VGNATLATNSNDSIGYSQTLQNVTASRALSQPYTNSTGKPIVLYIYGAVGTGGGLNEYLNGNLVGSSGNAGTGNAAVFISYIVPNGMTYEITASSSSITSWYELR